ncbi:hypothetical protein GTS_49800 [Gandjariella thermophila]|uniref:Type I restriction endonuclease subunit R n=1 Tax=Gandjariella thermophila TaxID=1931992 RepID=A0A4D4JHI2_9PSEU|nr:type I restriction enzyme endonuclease domain-containing protein [Gandjariella thermophila]GDY33347.1 hypothetical protein GTS_49800 [Gandjariella thermophila]
MIVKSMLLTGFDAPVEQVLYLDRHIKEAELLQAIARVNRTAANKKAGYVVDYYGVAEHLKVALAAYSSEDVAGALTSVADQVPLLADRYQRVRNVFLRHGIERFDSDSDVDACVEILADERLRAEFEAAFKLFSDSLEIVLPRPEALPYVRPHKVLGHIRFKANRRYRDDPDGFDVSLYGAKVRQLIDDHVIALDVRTKIPPVSITAPDFDAKVAALTSDRAKASEMEHAIRHHIREHLDEDPEHYESLSERLEHILTTFEGQWEQLADALRDFLPKVRAGRQADDSGLDPHTEAPFYGLLKQEMQRHGTPVAANADHALRQITVDLVRRIKDDISVVGFWENAYAQEALHKAVVRKLDGQQVDGEELFEWERLPEIAGRVVELAKANRMRLAMR